MIFVQFFFILPGHFDRVHRDLIQEGGGLGDAVTERGRYRDSDRQAGFIEPLMAEQRKHVRVLGMAGIESTLSE